MSVRARSFAFCGGAFGDEGKGRIVDEYVTRLSRQGPVVVYRDNGGANAGHTVTLPDGKKVALHQLPSGMFCGNTTVILGKGMVIHPGDFLLELAEVKAAQDPTTLAPIMIDELAVLSLDTHRAFESMLKKWEDGGKGSTGRGISPAYADVILRHPIRIRDIVTFNQRKLVKHYELYEALLLGLGESLSQVEVPTLDGKTIQVGSQTEFVARLKKQAKQLSEYAADVSSFLTKTWHNPKYAFVFEKAQAIGLDARWGVYPDVTASDCTFSGIEYSTEGVVIAAEIHERQAVIKATYMSSVGTRKLPTEMPKDLASKIREDAHEYGATTKRPRGIAYLDLPALRFYAKVGMVNTHVLTHMDIAYPNQPIKVCVAYEVNGQRVEYRPDQDFLSKVTPLYKELGSWDGSSLQQATKAEELPANAKQFIAFLEKELQTKVKLITVGPRRHQTIKL